MAYKDPKVEKEWQRLYYQEHKHEILAKKAALRTQLGEGAAYTLVKEWRKTPKGKAAKLRESIARRKRQAEKEGRQYEYKGRPPQLHDAHVRSWKRFRPVLHEAHVRVLFDSGTLTYRWRYANDTEFRLKECLRRQLRKKAGIERIEQAIRAAIKGVKTHAAMEHLLGYRMSELRQHLERQFVRGMSWKNYGKAGWHIDHIMPKRCFDLSKHDDIRSFWSLPNLRPLPASDNIKKHEKITHLL